MKKKNPSFWKTLSKLFSRESGFSLAEIMVAARLLGVVSLGVMQIMQNISKGSKKLEQDAEKSNVRNELYSLLSNKGICDAWLGGLTLTGNGNTGSGVAVPIIRRGPDGSDRVFMQPGTVFGAQTKGGMTVQSMELHGWKDGSANPPVYNITGPFDAYSYTDPASGDPEFRRKGTAEFRVILRKSTLAGASDDAIKRASFGGITTVIKLDLQIVTDNSDVVVSCFGNEDEYAESAYTAMGGTIATDGTCRNVVIKNDYALTPPTSVGLNPASNRYAVAAQGPVLLFGEGENQPATPGGEMGGVVISADQNTIGGGNTNLAGGVLMTGGGPNGINVIDDRKSGDLDVEGRVRIGFGGYGVTPRQNEQNNTDRGSLQVQRNTYLQGNVTIGDIYLQGEGPADPFSPARYDVDNVNQNGYLAVEANIQTKANIRVGKAAKAVDTTAPIENGFLDVAFDAQINRDLTVGNDGRINGNLGVGKAPETTGTGLIDSANHIRTDQSLYADVDANITRDVNVTTGNVNVNNGNVNIQGGDGNGHLTISNGDQTITQGYLNMVNTNNSISYIRLRATPTVASSYTAEQSYRVPNIAWVRSHVSAEIAKTFSANTTDYNALRADILGSVDGNDGIEIVRNYTCDAIRLRDKDGNQFSESSTCSFPSNDTRCDSNGKCSNVWAGSNGTNSGTLYAWRICIGTSRNQCKTGWGGGLSLSSCEWNVRYYFANQGNTNDNSTSGSYNNDANCAAGKVMAGLRRNFWRVSSGVYQWRSYIKCCSAGL